MKAIKPSQRILLAIVSLAALLSLSASWAEAATTTYFIDFNGVTTTTSSGNPNGYTWNNISSSALAALSDSTGLLSAASIQMVGSWGAGAGNGTPTTLGMTGAAATAFGGAQYTAANNLYYTGAATGTGGTSSTYITFTNLIPTDTYTFTIFASRNGGGNRDGLYTLVGGTTATGTLDASPNGSVNTANILTLTVTPTAAGVITLYDSLASDNTATFAYINALRIDATAVAVPEPATTALLGFGAIAFLGMRQLRRRFVAVNG
ncbi:PEP-CTERM protein-sorting domain-containing protein [Verrucomicrobium sp. GAS474]|uniref:PEP-CTERM sorting domain-containing protein n=1 Tax=Verrucomicrobium sp. GAS474 TaxID=1882831 RepID=UPI00087B8FBE|nr:PEP-CTERM sorting domain-containing protein [Verrucomicrobium sp. GAS474]SDU02766.1 PEP-CTERM protein-sorting domain-containing protein [Verrucomicrobium sp. GAS474]